jgi:NAD(P)H dehydrogenase (quinone)
MYSRGKMRGRRALVAASLGGQEHMFGSQAVHGPLHEGMMSHLLRGTLGVVGYDVVQPFWAYHAPYVDEGARADLLAGLRRHVERLDEAPILAMPDLEQYDRRFRPLADS